MAGAVYNIDGKFYMGPNTFKGISFGHDVRKPLATPATSADAEMLIPKLPPITKITIGKRLPEKKPNRDVPGAIYDVHVRYLMLIQSANRNNLMGCLYDLETSQFQNRTVIFLLERPSR